jgi:DNA modification methylase
MDSVIERTHGLEVEMMSVMALKPYARNPRQHSGKPIQQLADRIREFGFTNPLLIDTDGGVIAGHGRLEAAKLLGIVYVPTIRLDHMTEAQKRAYIIADNKLAENAGWDRELLAVELQYLDSLELDFDLTITGFETVDIDLMIQGDGKIDAAADEIPDLLPPVSQIGDLWLLGQHRLLCADAMAATSYDTLLGHDRAQMVFIDPPYNVRIDGHVCGSGSIKHREFGMAAGEMSEVEFISFLTKAFESLANHSLDGSIHYVCMDWRHLSELTAAGRAVYSEVKNLCVWNKDNGGMGSLYRSKHELIFVFKNGRSAHINNIELGRHGRNRTNVWDYAGVNSFGQDRLDELAMHPTVKPVAMVADALLDCSLRDGIVLDCFGGSGTTLIAAEKTGRRGRVIELDPAYVDVTIRRFEKLIGKEATHAQSGLTFKDMRSRRGLGN